MVTADVGPLEGLLHYLKSDRGFDFTGYKRPSLERRIAKRMHEVRCESFGDYHDFLEVHPDEFTALFNTILINVTSFFRDGPTWEGLRALLPSLLEEGGDNRPVRVWSAGCASGEEAYTLAILLAEALGVRAFQRRVKIYGTDVDDDALELARAGRYTARDVQSMPEDLRSKYFLADGPGFVFRRDLRRNLIFGRHDMIKDAPISRLDLLACRNVLMYFNSEVQGRIIDSFNFALRDDGLLVLGRAETLLGNQHGFEAVDVKRRIFARPRRLPSAHPTAARRSFDMEDEAVTVPGSEGPLSALVEGGPYAQLLVGREGRLVLANARARALFSIGRRDVDRPLADLEVAYRPVELRSEVERVLGDRQSVVLRDVARASGPRVDFFDVTFTPVLDGAGEVTAVSVWFQDVSRVRELQDELERTQVDLQTAYEELQSTNEELETMNEELHSTNEELKTTNEELQSTNEELETMNEELHSTNDELHAINDELQARSDELNELNAFLEAILSSVRGVVVVVDQEVLVRMWNQRAEDVWGLRSDEVRGKNLLNLDMGLPTDTLRTPIQQCLGGRAPRSSVVVNGRDRLGRDLVCEVTCSPLTGAGGVVSGVILMIEAQAQDEV
ncbi:MAG TPA: CheR family methyltransferase [Acidimicrobiales bacterium]|jgi:two-component system CheB/CheR fusion protein|nr:CheR family methyltransferase [Acidimicrobiales bacterium]